MAYCKDITTATKDIATINFLTLHAQKTIAKKKKVLFWHIQHE
jgi:hypothetical protein